MEDIKKSLKNEMRRSVDILGKNTIEDVINFDIKDWSPYTVQELIKISAFVEKRWNNYIRNERKRWR